MRDFTKLERYSDADLLKAAVILADVYRSVDLAHLLLIAYDARRGTALAPRYHEAMLGKPLNPLFLNVA